MPNTKEAFYVVKEHLAARPVHLAEVLRGSSCEAWLNTEIRVGLIEHFKTTQHANAVSVHTESLKRDVIWRNESMRVSHAFECKVMYPWTNNKLLAEKLRPLRRQLVRTPKEDELSTCRHVGFLFAVWFEGNERNEEEGAFYTRMKNLTEQTFDPGEWTTQHGFTFERTFGGKLRCPPGQRVNLGAVYITRR